MIVAQCVLVAALVLVHSTSSPTMPTTTAMETSTATPTVDTSTTDQNVTLSTTTSPPATSEDVSEPAITDDTTTENARMTTTDRLATFFNITSTFVESIATMAKPKVTNETNMLSSLSNGFVFTSTWIIVIAVGGFTLLTAMPLLIIMILIVALGCMCKKYKRMKKRLIMPAETVASNNDYREMTTAMNSDVVLRNIVILDGIDTGTNVAYGQTSTVVESCDIRKNTMSTQNTKADGQNYESNNIVMTGDNVAYGRMSVVVEGTTGCDDMATQDDTAEDDGDTDYVINDVYDSIDT